MTASKRIQGLSKEDCSFLIAMAKRDGLSNLHQIGLALKQSKVKYAVQEAGRYAGRGMRPTYTVCLLDYGARGRGVGVADCSHADEFSPELGKRLSLLRAFRSLHGGR